MKSYDEKRSYRRYQRKGKMLTESQEIEWLTKIERSEHWIQEYKKSNKGEKKVEKTSYLSNRSVFYREVDEKFVYKESDITAAEELFNFLLPILWLWLLIHCFFKYNNKYCMRKAINKSAFKRKPMNVWLNKKPHKNWLCEHCSNG